MSMAFRVHRQEWNEAFDQRRIQEVSLAQGDISVVNYGASPHTAGTVSMRRKGAPDLRGQARPAPKRLALPDYVQEAQVALRRERLRHPKRPRQPLDAVGEAASRLHLAKLKIRSPR